MRARRRTLSAAVAAAAVAAAAAAPGAAAAASPVKISARAVAAPLTAKPAKTTVTVRNTGRRRLGGLALSIGAPKGVKVALAGARRGRLTRALKPLRPGRSASVGLRLSRTSRGPQRGSLAVKVTSGRRTLVRARLAFGGSDSTRPGPPQPPPNPNTLAGRYFWGSQYTISGIQQHTLWFTGDGLVWTEATESAWPTCTAVTEQCKAYSYDARANALTIDGKPSQLEPRKLTFDEDTYFEFGFPPAGTRWDTVVTYANSSGICPLYCSYYTENLTFRPDGTFIRDAVSSGTGPIVDWAAIPPDSKGTYEVRADRTLRLAYADGRERIETVALFMNDDGTLKPAGEGILLGGDGYFDIRD